MELINATRMVAGFNVGLDVDGRELLVVVIKGTFVLPQSGESVRLHERQVPLVMADTFSGEPGQSAPIHEVDFAPRKHHCDVLLLGHAHAPGGRPVTRTQVTMQVGPVNKTMDVVGPRVWEAGVTGIRASEPAPFVTMPISYDLAFGGVDQASEDPAQHDAFLLNPAGQGYRKQLNSAWIDGLPLPCTEEPGVPVTWPSNSYKPMALGPLGRGWQQRACYAGTYDQHWLDHDFPFLPKDFDERYYQAAPLDQQMPIPSQALDVVLQNLTPDGFRRFTLPHFDAPVYLFPRRGDREDHVARLDTIVMEPDEDRLTLTWRLTRPIRRDPSEILQIHVGKLSRDQAWIDGAKRFPIPVVAVSPVAKGA